MNTKLQKLKTIGIPLTVVLIIILGVIFLLSRNNQSSTNNNQAPVDTSLGVKEITVLPTENQNLIKLAESTITFDNFFVVNTVVQGEEINGVQCGSDSGVTCIFNLITDGTDTYFLATPFAPMAQDGVNREKDINKNIDLNSGTVELKYTTLETFNEAGDLVEDKSVVSQIYGCIKDGVCVGSGVFDINDYTKNKEQVLKFENFLKSLTIQ